MVKPGSNGNVTAKRVYELKPMLQTIPHKIIHVINDDSQVLEDNMPVVMKQNVGFSQLSNDDPCKNKI